MLRYMIIVGIIVFVPVLIILFSNRDRSHLPKRTPSGTNPLPPSATPGHSAPAPDLNKGLPAKIRTHRGRVKWFNPQKGYGFVAPLDGGRDVFIHISALERAGLSSVGDGWIIDYELDNRQGKVSVVDIYVVRR